MTDSDEEPMALSGLRRMVLHARNSLHAVAVQPPAEFGYDKHWRPATIRQHAAMMLAEQVLTLVADCLPGGEAMTPDEAEQYRAERDEVARKAEERAKKAQEAAKVAEQRALNAEADREVALEAQEDAEAIEVEQATFIEEVRALARTDVPAAIRRLLGEAEPPAEAVEDEEPSLSGTSA